MPQMMNSTNIMTKPTVCMVRRPYLHTRACRNSRACSMQAACCSKLQANSHNDSDLGCKQWHTQYIQQLQKQVAAAGRQGFAKHVES